MIKSLRLERFTNFQDARLELGPFTVLIGANAAGKSNIRDAFWFLHGIGRGYSLAEILGEKYVGGERVWSGIRGGTREVAYVGSKSFALTVGLKISSPQLRPPGPFPLDYSIEVMVEGPTDKPPQIANEQLNFTNKFYGFFVKERIDKNNVKAVFRREKGIRGAHPPSRLYISGMPVVSQVAEDDEVKSRVARTISRATVEELGSFRFLDLSPTQMRIPSLPGQTTLGDRGENLSSVLFAICDDPSTKDALLEWVRKLTPMDVDDLDFDRDAVVDL